MSAKRNVLKRTKIVAWSFVLALLGFSSDAFSYSTLPEAYSAAGFDPTASNCWVFAAIGDPHYSYQQLHNSTQSINEINAMSPPPAFVYVAGDLIGQASTEMGTVPTAGNETNAKQEFQYCKNGLDQLTVPYKLVLGNHDTYPYENPPGALFYSVFSSAVFPLYQFFKLNGIHFMFFFGHSTGYFGDDERQAAKDYMAANVSSTDTVICATHIPFEAPNVQHGAPRLVKELFSEHEGELWLIAGHDHNHVTDVYNLPKTKIVEARIPCSYLPKTTPSWTHGWSVYCIRDRHVVARIFRDFDGGYNVVAAPNYSGAKNIMAPFEGVTNICLRELMGVDDVNRNTFLTPFTPKYFISAGIDFGYRYGGANDCINNWYYVSKLLYKFPLSGLRNPEKLVILASYKMSSAGTTVQVSNDNVNWSRLQYQAVTNNSYIFAIPVALRSGNDLYVNVLSDGYGIQVTVAGFAICGPQTASGVPDDDHDRMADNWENYYFGGTNVLNGGPLDDWDGDGMKNVQEYIAGTDPTNRTDRFELSIGRSNGQVVVSFPMRQGVSDYYGLQQGRYQFEQCGDLFLTNWVGIDGYTNIPATDSQVVYTSDVPAAVRFFRGRVWRYGP